MFEKVLSHFRAWYVQPGHWLMAAVFLPAVSVAGPTQPPAPPSTWSCHADLCWDDGFSPVIYSLEADGTVAEGFGSPLEKYYVQQAKYCLIGLPNGYSGPLDAYILDGGYHVVGHEEVNVAIGPGPFAWVSAVFNPPIVVQDTFFVALHCAHFAEALRRL